MDSFIPWVGGKKLLRGEIVKRFPQNIDRYVEVFGGAAWVLFYRQQYAKQEVYNDINGELVNLFRMVKYHPAAIIEELKFTLNASQTFLDFKINKNIGETEKLVVRYHGRLLMNCCSAVLANKRHLAAEGIWRMAERVFLKSRKESAFYFKKKRVCPEVRKKYSLLQGICAL